MSKQKQKGTSFESQVVSYLRHALGDERIERRATTGAKDRGDISGLFFRGMRVVAECKNHARAELARWLDEAEEERGNDGAEYGVVIHKRKGCGEKSFGETYVTMTLHTFAAMLVGGRDLLYYDRLDRPSGHLLLRERGIDEDG